MKSGCGLSKFEQSFPNRFFDVGIAESHAVTFAAGLAASGLSPFVCIYSTFLQRAFDQIYHDVVLSNLPVRFIVDKAGFPGEDGKTHSGIYDLALAFMFENFKIFAPSNRTDLVRSLDAAVSNDASPTIIRFPKAETPIIVAPQLKGHDILIMIAGALLPTAQRVRETLFDKIDIWDICLLQPFDFDSFSAISTQYRLIVIVEDGIYGGFTARLLQFISQNRHEDIFRKTHIINLSQTPVGHTFREKQYCDSNITVAKLVELFRLNNIRDKV
jgi:1-deoxy-D-xylulose-5-phosphate synthase